MSFLAFLATLLLLTFALLNFFTIRRPRQAEAVSNSVVILLPMRNEEENVERLFAELSRQKFLSNYKVIAIDDGSTDRTRALAESLQSSVIEVVSAPDLPAGWIGKVNALQAGYNHPASQNAEFIISIDADVSFADDAIARAVVSIKASGLDFISPYPRQIALSWAERLSQPLLQWSWMSTLFLRGAERFPRPSTVVCNGQFLVLRKSALENIGGFTEISGDVLDDIALGRALVKGGFSGTVIDGSAIATTRMYSNFSEVRAGYGKSLHRAFGSIFGSLFVVLFIFFTGIYPLIALIRGDLFGLLALTAVIATRYISALASQGRKGDSLLHPFSSLLFIYLLYFSWRNRGRTTWKGRTL